MSTAKPQQISLQQTYVAFAAFHAISRAIVEEVSLVVTHIGRKLAVLAQAELSHGDATQEHTFDASRVSVSVAITVEAIVSKI